MRISPATGLTIVLAIGATAIGAYQYEKSQKEQNAKQQFLSSCQEENETAWCETQVTENHSLCFQQNYRRQSDGLRNTADVYIFKKNLYNNCLYDGYDAWNQALVAKNRSEREFVQEHLN